MLNTTFARAFLAILISLAVVASAVMFSGYVVDQQIVRQAANEPQVQLAESIALQINAGVPPESIVQGGAMPLELMQTPFILIYDSTGTLVGANASLAGAAPVLPEGTLGATKGIGPKGENRVTWQPNPDIRAALVIVPYSQGEKSGYVVAGRSLRETEAIEHLLLVHTLIGWAVTMVAVIIVAFVGAILVRRKLI